MNFDSSLFTNYWHLVCHKNELSNDGDFVKFDTPIGDVVLFNDMGNVVAFDNICPHRGAKIYTQDSGNQSGSCKYHRWAYRNSKLIVPDKQNFIDCDIENADLNKYRLEQCGEFLFLGIEPKFELHEQLGDVIFQKLEKMSFSIEKRRDFNRYDFCCYWAVAVENALETYHVPVVHPKTLGSLELENYTDFFEGVNSVLYAEISNKKVKKQLSLFRKFFNIEYQYEGYEAVYLFPFSMIASNFGYAYSLQNFFPNQQNANTTKFTSRIFDAKLLKPEFSELLESFFTSYALSARQILEEDHEVCKLVARESWTMQPLKYASKLEKKIEHFRQVCQLALQENLETKI